MSSIEAAFFGALGRDGETETSKAGRSYLRLNVRVGEGDAAQWISVMSFDQSAISTADQFTKGARVYCEGKLGTDEWMKDGVKRFGLSLMSSHTRLAQIGRNKSKAPNDVRGEGRPASQSNDLPHDEIPF